MQLYLEMKGMPSNTTWLSIGKTSNDISHTPFQIECFFLGHKIKNHVIILENVLRVFFLYKNQVERKFAITIPTLCYLWSDETDKDASALNWYRRLEIALGVAQGLEYLHTFAVNCPYLIHVNVLNDAQTHKL
mgnify:CR=1 FL=1